MWWLGHPNSGDYAHCELRKEEIVQVMRSLAGKDQISGASAERFCSTGT